MTRWLGSKTYAVALLLTILTLVEAVPAAAQTSALAKHNTEAPVDFDADHVEVRDNDQQALLTGSVRITQGTLTLTADQVKMFYRRAPGKQPEIERMDAQGNVKLTSPSERASGRYGIYDVTQRIITLSGDVVLTRGESVLRGQRLSIDLDSGRSTLDSAGTGGGKSTGSASGGRVSGRFVVPPRRAK